MDKKTFHFIGIGGIGMSALARILLQQGFSVQGSDTAPSLLLDQLEREGAKISIGHKAEGMEGSTVVYSSAVAKNNVEFVYAQKLGLPLLHRSDLLDRLMRIRSPLLVTGTHGKTTTAALLSSVLMEANTDPSFVVGGVVQSLQTNGRNGRGSYFVAESDESDGSFLKTHSFGAIVTNCENDHLDYWGSSKRLHDGFRIFFSQVMHPKHLFWCRDDEHLCSLSPLGFSYGFSPLSNLLISGYRQEENSIFFDIFFQGKQYIGIELALSGRHNALNGAAVLGLCLSLDIEERLIRKAFREFKGVKRRLEWKGDAKGVQFIDDYGHHPTEIRATVKAMKARIKEKRLVLVFQPHRFSRTRDLWREFITCFEGVDILFLTDIYTAGETLIPGVTGEKLAIEVGAAMGGKVRFLPRTHLEEGVVLCLQSNDVVLTMGAGDVTKAGESILKLYESRK